MTKKRKQQGQASSDFSQTKRLRSNQIDGNDDSPSTPQSKIDQTYGQRGAFPGLDGPAGSDELFYGPANDGLEYLRMVRSEAKTVPNLLVAPSSPAARPQEENLYADYPQGFYSDGAYTALPSGPPEQLSCDNAGQVAETDPQEAYYTSLQHRFAALSSTLQHPPPTFNTPSFTIYKPRQWCYRILNTEPKMPFLAQMPQENIIRGLETLDEVLTAGNLKGKRGRRIGAWAWGLLGRCRDVGEMGSEEVGVLRGLGKRAGWCLRRLGAGEEVGGEEGKKGAEEEGEEEEGDEKGGGQGGDEFDEEDGEITHGDDHDVTPNSPHDDAGDETSLDEARERLLSSLPPSSQPQTEPSSSTGKANDKIDVMDEIDQPARPQSNGEAKSDERPGGSGYDPMAVHATLDMIVTIVGECYGQKDLLNGRLLWEELDGMK